MQIAGNCVVSIHYTLTSTEGEILDTSDGRDPLVYLHGADNIIPGLESALLGKSAGDSVETTVQPEDGYGPVNEEMIQTVPRDAFGGVDKIEPGMEFEASDEEGGQQMIVVTAVGENEVTVDGNHPLAGQVLNFAVSVEDVRAATEEEIAHGHAHGPEGHHHH